MKKRILSITLTLCMVLSLLPTVALPAKAAGPLNIANGSISIVDGTSGTITVKQNNVDVAGYTNIAPTTDITLTGTTNIIIYKGVTPPAHPVIVEVNPSVTVNLTLDGVDLSTTQYSHDYLIPVLIKTGMVNLNLVGTNKIQCTTTNWVNGDLVAVGILANTNTTLTIDGTGTLSVIGDNTYSEHAYGISADNLVIKGGTLILEGKAVSLSLTASPVGMYANNITFSGGNVTAKGIYRGIWGSITFASGALGSVSATGGQDPISAWPLITTGEILDFSNGSLYVARFNAGANPPNNVTFTYSPAPTTVSLAPGSLGVVGNGTITGLTPGCMYKVTEGTGTPTIKWAQSNGGLSATESSVGALDGNSITNLTNGTTYLVEQVFPVTLTITGGNGTDSVTMAGNSYKSGTATIHPVKGTNVVVSATPDAARGATFTGDLTAAGTISDISQNTSFKVTFAALAPTVGSISPVTIKTGEVPNLTAPTVNYNGLSSVSAGWEIKKSGGAYTTYTGTALDVSYHGASLRYFAKNSAGTAYSNEVLVTVNKFSPAVSISASPSSPQTYPIPSGIVLTATLSNAYQLSGQTITFKNGGTTLGTGRTDDGGIATYTVSTPSSGTYNFTAGFEADANNNLATSSQVSYTINKGTQSTPLFANTTVIEKKITDTSFSLPAVSGGEGTGNYSYASSDTNVLTVSGTGNIATATIVGAGNATVKVQKLGDANYNDSAYSEDISIAISKHTPTAADFTYTAPTALNYDNTAKSASVTAKSGILGMGAVTVKYYKDGTEVATPTDAGTYTVKISVAQGGNYVAASDITDNDWTFTIAKVAQKKLAITKPTAVVTYGDTFTLATTGGSGNGDVTWKVTSGDSATVNESTGSVTITGVSETTITATKAADRNYTADVTGTYTFTPAKLKLTINEPPTLGGWTKQYDGKTDFEKTNIAAPAITNKVGVDNVYVSVENATFDNANVGSAKNLTITYSIGGGASGKYTVPTNTVIANASITAATPTAADFTYTAPASLLYSGTGKSATVAAKSGISGMGIITVKYYKDGTEVAAPTDAGNFTVTISVAQGENYATVTDFTDAWTFTIDKVAQEKLTITSKPTSVTYGDAFTLASTGGSGTGAVTWAVTKGDSATVDASTGAVTVTGVGETTITATKAADGNHTKAVTDTYTFTPAKRQLTLAPPSETGGFTKSYDASKGFNAASVPVGTMTNKVGADTVTVAVQSASYDTAAVGAGNKALTITYRVEGKDSGKYSAPTNTVIPNASITAATPTIQLEKKIAVRTDKIIEIDAATVKGVGSDGDISKNYSGAITYTYYTKEACAEADRTTTEQSGAQTIGGAPKESGTYYVKAAIAAKGNYTNASSAPVTLTIYRPSSGGGTPATAENNSSSPVIVDGKVVEIGKSEVKGSTTTVKVDQNKLTEQIKNAKDSVFIPITAKTDTATAQLVVQNVEDMAAQKLALTVQSGKVSYNLDTAAIDTKALASAFSGTDTKLIPFQVTIANSPVKVEGANIIVPPVEFTITASYGGKTVEVDTFKSFINRTIEISAEQAKKITTAVVVEKDGALRHVPTNVMQKNGTYYAVINSLTNSTYTLIENEVKFTDASGTWYEKAVNEMGSRKTIGGIGDNRFAGETSVTRAEFAAILVRALGLPTDSTAASKFTDVSSSQWYYGAVGTAYAYDLVSGKREDRFDPNANITRQEAMAMIARAAKVASYTGSPSSLADFSDADKLGSWAVDSAKFNVGTGLIIGNNANLRPQDQISRAETATVILRLLQKADLVDVRN